MILDLERDTCPTEADIVIIGAGVVGTTLAVELARAGRQVVLCESGGRTVEAKALALNEAVVVGRPHAGITEGRARQLGGTSTLWGGQLIPFRDIDFADRPWLGLEAWPITGIDLAPWYDAALRPFGLPQYGKDCDAVWDRLKLPAPTFGPDVDFVMTRWLREPNVARHFASDLKGNPNLTVVVHACAVAFENEGGTITAVTLASPSGKRVRLAGKVIINACGTIEANRLMLATAHANPALPWADNAWIGRAFQDHLDLRVADVEPIDRKRFADTFDNIFIEGFKYTPKVVLSQPAQEKAKVSNVGGVLVRSSLTEHLGNVKIFLRALRNGAVPPNLKALPSHFAALAKVWWPLVTRYLRDNRAFNPADLGIGLRAHCEQLPHPDSRITLSPDRVDAYGVPQAVLDWRVDPAVIGAMAEFCRAVSEALEAKGLARLRVDPRLAALDPSLLDDARDTNHHCGGLRMAVNPAEGVVDAQLRVHGTDNFYVAGAAVFPSSSFANPTFTAMALAMRLADRLRKAA
jgi:choline dehydrogenase-like flavoprotein